MSKLTQSVFILDRYIAHGRDIVSCLFISGKIVEGSLKYFETFVEDAGADSCCPCVMKRSLRNPTN